MKKIYVFILFALCVLGCDEDIVVPILSDSEEIERYLVDDNVGKLFFSQENLNSELPYTFPFDSTGYYVDIKDSIVRIVNAKFPLQNYGAGYTDPYQEFGPPFGESQDSEVEVIDKVYAYTIRVEGTDTTIMNQLLIRDYKRYGYFMKLGNDGQKYSGWILRGFSGGLASSLSNDVFYVGEIEHENKQIFSYRMDNYESLILNDNGESLDTIREYSTDRAYKLLNGDGLLYPLVERVSYGETLKAEYSLTSGSVFQTMLYNNGDSTILKNFTSAGGLMDEVSVTLSSDNSKTWDFIYFQEFHRHPTDTSAIPRFQTLQRRNWIIPIKYE